MTVWSALYTLLIGPLELVFEVIFSLALRVVHHPGTAIIFLSLAMNFLVLPLYKRADAMQAEERDLEASLEPWATHIKKTFKGDERFMMLQAFYRQRNYKPSYALKGSLSLLLEIPFFIAAYRFLSALPLLQGVSFGPIRDLGLPDGLITLSGRNINILPVLMTLINAVSATVYMKGFPLKSKLQMYGMALVFLVFLYDSPSGLVFYWTLNNVFSLLKNLFYKLKKPGLVLACLASAIGICGLAVILFFRPMETERRQYIAVIGTLMLQLPLLFRFIRQKTVPKSQPVISARDKRLFLLGCLFLTVLVGALIPTSVISSSPVEFVSVVEYRSPLWYVANSMLLAAGTFLVWFYVFYNLASPRGRKNLSCLIWILCGAAITDYMFFGTDYGNLSTYLIYDNLPLITIRQSLVNISVIAVVALIIWLLWTRLSGLAGVICLASCIAITGMSANNVIGIQKTMTEFTASLDQAQSMPEITLSKNGKNVLVLMLDRAVSSYVPFLMNEKPELQSQFEGFTYYPNTISFGQSTNFGVPPLFGGYEYTPEEMNKRDQELLVDKHNEAMKVMPVLFDEAGFEVTVCDPTYAGYQYIPDLSIYSDYPEIKTYITSGKFTQDIREDYALSEKTRNRNFFCFSITKIAPLFIQPTLYNNGVYNQAVLSEDRDTINMLSDNITESVSQTMSGISKAKGLDTTFMDAYCVLTNLPAITVIEESDSNTFLMLSNDTTHSVVLLQEPDYVPASVVDNTEFDSIHYDRISTDGRVIHLEDKWQTRTYQVDMAAFIQLGRWFDYLRECGVYDNTRIIIVSDHGWPLGHFENMIIGGGWGEDVMRYNPVLMVKDFNAHQFRTDWQFMTNADVPTLAADGLIDDPVNPFTGKQLNSNAKNTESGHLVFWSPEWNIYDNHGTTYIPGTWYLVGDNIFDPDEWTMILDEMED